MAGIHATELASHKGRLAERTRREGCLRMRIWRSLPVLAMLCALPLVLTGCGDNSPPDFVLELGTDEPAAVSITQGGRANITFQVAALKDSTGSITLALSGLPDGVGVAPGVATVGIGSPQEFLLTAASTAEITSAPVTLTATGVSGNPLSASSITHTQTVTLSVVAPAAP
jgi:hypothetical protein